MLQVNKNKASFSSVFAHLYVCMNYLIGLYSKTLDCE